MSRADRCRSSTTTPKGLSPSGIRLYRQCPLRYYFVTMAKLSDPPSHSAVVDTLVGRILGGLFRLAPEERTVDAARQIAEDVWSRYRSTSKFVGLG